MAPEPDRAAGAALAQAAASLAGVPFRLHGRDPETGLDCVGLVLCALAACGRPVPRLPRHGLRMLKAIAPGSLLPAAGFEPVVAGRFRPGDLLLLRPGPAQVHLALVGLGRTAIHADATLGRVVAAPLPLPWPTSGHWRPTETIPWQP